MTDINITIEDSQDINLTMEGSSICNWDNVFNKPSEITDLSETISSLSDVAFSGNISDLTNNDNYVQDASYVHTDNNFTDTLKSNYDAAYTHSTNTSNPHSITKTQVGLGNVPNVRPCYALQIYNISANNLSANTTYYTAPNATGLTTSGNVYYDTIINEGVITAVSTYIACSSGASSETASLYVRINNTTDYLVSSSIVFNTNRNRLYVTGLNIPVSVGDTWELKLVMPSSMTTTPNNALARCVVKVDL